MELVFLGTACMKPTKERNASSVLLSYGSNGILFDCGEGVQRQLRIAGIKPSKINKILISHWHGDHVLGLAGLIQTIISEEENKEVVLYGPVGSKSYVKNLFSSFAIDKNIELKVEDIKEGVFFEGEKYCLEALPLKHKTKTLGFSFIEKDKRKINLGFVKRKGIPEGPLLGNLQQNRKVVWKGKTIKPEDATYVVKGKKITYITDTTVCENCVKLAENTDILISEAVYVTKLEKKARKHMHLTAKQAGIIANRSNAKKLLLTHFSQRYKNTQEIEEEARSVFDNVVCAKDFTRIKL